MNMDLCATLGPTPCVKLKLAVQHRRNHESYEYVAWYVHL